MRASMVLILKNFPFKSNTSEERSIYNTFFPTKFFSSTTTFFLYFQSQISCSFAIKIFFLRDYISR